MRCVYWQAKDVLVVFVSLVGRCKWVRVGPSLVGVGLAEWDEKTSMVELVYTGASNAPAI